jgi:hypothetical protein
MGSRKHHKQRGAFYTMMVLQGIALLCFSMQLSGWRQVGAPRLVQKLAQALCAPL